MTNIFKKKFSVRVRLYYDLYYAVEYANYRFFEIWTPIIHFRTPASVLSSIDPWVTLLFDSHEEAENFAKKLNTYDDVVNFYINSVKLEDEFKERKAKYLNERRPYQIKIIK